MWTLHPHYIFCIPSLAYIHKLSQPTWFEHTLRNGCFGISLALVCSIPLTYLSSFAPGPNTRIEDKSVVELDDYVLEPAEDEEEDQFSGARYQYYKSEKILGQLYRAIDVSKIWKEDIRSKMRPAGASFWDEFILKIRPRYEAIVGHVQTWTVHLETAREIRGWYEAAISDAMAQYSEHPIKPLTELEVFIGNILNRSGVQTNRQRDSSTKLRDEFERISNCTSFLYVCPLLASRRLVRKENKLL